MLLGLYLIKVALRRVVVELASLDQVWVLYIENLRLEEGLVYFRVFIAACAFILIVLISIPVYG